MPYFGCSRRSARFHRAAVDSEGEFCPRCAAPLVDVSCLRPPVAGRDRLVDLVQRTFVVADAQRTCSGGGA
jgi:hypothetical protein